MLGIIWTGFWILIPAIIYLDATGHQIGKIKGDKSFLNMSAGGWSGATVLIGIITLPLYLFARGKLITKAQENPVDVGTGHRIIVTIILLGVSVGMAVLLAKMHH